MTTDRNQPLVQVDSVWKVFGPNPLKVLEPQFVRKEGNFLQEQLGNVVALRDVSFEVTQGETFVIMGLSGSGKSTMVRCLIRLIDPTAGSIVIGGDNVTEMSDQELLVFRRSKISMVFQNYGLMPHRNVLDNAAWGLEIQGIDESKRYLRTRQVLELVGLGNWENSYPDQLSGGMQQRVGLARSLVVDTDILLMDEPFSGLDPLIRRQLQDELIRLQSELNKTIIFITHDLDEALRLGDRIAIMHNGGIAQIDSPSEIVLHPATKYVVEFTQDVRVASILTAQEIMNTPNLTLVESRDSHSTLVSFAEGHQNSAWIVDHDHCYRGLLTVSSAKRILKAGIRRLDQADEWIDRDFQSVLPDSLFDQLIPKILNSKYPLPVVNKQNLLIGEVRHSSLAEALNERPVAA